MMRSLALILCFLASPPAFGEFWWGLPKDSPETQTYRSRYQADSRHNLFGFGGIGYDSRLEENLNLTLMYHGPLRYKFSGMAYYLNTSLYRKGYGLELGLLNTYLSMGAGASLGFVETDSEKSFSPHSQFINPKAFITVMGVRVGMGLLTDKNRSHGQAFIDVNWPLFSYKFGGTPIAPAGRF